MMAQFAALSGTVQKEKRSTPDVDADTEAEREQDAQADSRNEEDAVSGCPHPAASVPTGQVDGSTPAAGHENLLGSDGGASETVIEQNLEPGPENAVEEWLNEAARASADSSTSSSGDYSHAGTNQTLHSVQDDLGSRDSVSASGQASMATASPEVQLTVRSGDSVSTVGLPNNAADDFIQHTHVRAADLLGNTLALVDGDIRIYAQRHKVAAVMKMPEPKRDRRQLLSALASASWWRKSIPGFAKITEPLYALTAASKVVKKDWSGMHSDA
eukprot:SAG11_NODE_7999_length_1071_cov_12.791152_2_plen_272_part_01